MGEHAKYSASGASRWLNCSGSIALSELAPPQPESRYAEEGTTAHKYLEAVLKGEEVLGCEADMWDHVISAAEWIWEQAGDEPLLCETKVDATPFTCEGQFGTLDAAIVREFDRLTVIDFKFGAGLFVDPKDNPQLIYYALGLSYQYHHNFSEVELVVIQPRAYSESGETIRTHVMSIDELLEWVPKFADGVLASVRHKDRYQPGEWCRFCPAAIICPALKREAIDNAQLAFSVDMTLESVPEPKLIQIPHLGNILTACDRLEDWIKKVREHAIHVLEKGEDVPGYKLVQKRGVRKWVDEKHVEGLQDIAEVYCQPKVLSPAQFEKANPNLKNWVLEHTISESSGTTLAPESDKRPAVKPSNKFDVEYDGVKQLPAVFTAPKGRKKIRSK